MIQRIQQRRMRGAQGLTLIELLIVIVILGVLSGIIVFSVQGITDRGEAASCQASTQTVRIASETFRANDAQTKPAGSLQILADSGFLTLPLPGQINGNQMALQSGGTITYDPASGEVTSDCATVGSPGGGGGPSVEAIPPGGPITGGESVALNATVSGGTATQVEFLVDDGSAGVDNDGSPWTINWLAVSGNHTLVARATINGSPVESPGVALNVDAAPVACSFVSFAPTSVEVTPQPGGGSDNGTIAATNFVVTMTGDCTPTSLASVTASVDRNDNNSFSGGEGLTLTPDGTRHTWTAALPTTGWDENGGTVDVQIQFTGTASIATVNSQMDLTDPPAPCAFGSFAPDPINTTNGGGSNQTLQFPQDATVTFTGGCSAITAVQLLVDKNDDGDYNDPGENHGNMTGSGNSWTVALSDTGWNDDETIIVRIIVTGGSLGTINTTTHTQ